MVGTPEEDLLAWLEREETELRPDQTFGERFAEVHEALTDIDKARELFYRELGYDIKDEQFEALRHASTLRYEELPTIGISYGRIEQKWGYQETYRDVITGRFVSSTDVYSLLATIR